MCVKLKMEHLAAVYVPCRSDESERDGVVSKASFYLLFLLPVFKDDWHQTVMLQLNNDVSGDLMGKLPLLSAHYHTGAFPFHDSTPSQS